MIVFTREFLLGTKFRHNLGVMFVIRACSMMHCTILLGAYPYVGRQVMEQDSISCAQ